MNYLLLSNQVIILTAERTGLAEELLPSGNYPQTYVLFFGFWVLLGPWD